MEIESRLLPCGLHTIGEAPTAEEAVATLVNIASLEREQEGRSKLTLAPRSVLELFDKHVRFLVGRPRNQHCRPRNNRLQLA